MAKDWYEIKALADDTAEVWIYDQIGEDWWTGEGITAKNFSTDLAALKVSNIALHINSPGGSVFDGQAIYNALKRHPATVTSYIDGLAASIASVIAMAGESVVMAANSLMMIHNPYGSTTGTAEDMRATADILDKVRGTIVGAYTEKTGQPDGLIGELMDAETWMNAEDAQALGFADAIGDELQLAASFDLTRFKNAPQPAQAVEPEAASEAVSDTVASEAIADEVVSEAAPITYPARIW